MNLSHSRPLESLREGQLSRWEPFLSLLAQREAHGQLIPGKVIFADDQLINQHLMRQHFADLGIADTLITFSDGQGVV